MGSAGTFEVYRRVVLSRIRGQMSYRLSFTFEVLGQVVSQSVELVVILVVFTRVRDLGGFSAREVLLMYALAGMGFGLAQLTVGQLDNLSHYIRRGEFDVLLLRPLSPLAQLLTTEVHLRRIGRALAALGVLGYVLSTIDLAWTLGRVLLIVLTPVCGAVIIGSVWVIASSVSFWLVEGRELANVVTYGSNVFTSYPTTVFSGWLRRFMAFVVPGAFVAYYPTLELLGRPDPLGAPRLFNWLGPPFAIAVMLAASVVWRFAVRRYRGTGS